MTKLEKIDKELDKAREKAAEWQAKVRDLEKQRQEEENSMIVQAVRSLKLTPSELAAFFSNPTITTSGQLGPKPDEAKEDTEHEKYDKPGFDEHIAGTDIEIKYFETRLGEDTVQLAKGFDGVCVFVNDTVNEKVINELYDLGVRVIALRCAGFNNVDTKACFGKLHVFRVPAYSPYAVAEHAMALLLTVNRHTNKAYIRTRDFNFSLSGLTGFDLHGKTVGVVGTGKIGRIFAEICKGFGMRVLAYDKFPNPESGLDYVELPELLRQADVVSLHCPLTDETRHMIDADAIAQMKPGVVLVNTSRGGLVDTEALIEGLKSRKVGAACLDVYEEEGDLFYEDCSEEIVADDTLVRLISMPNVIVTSHQAFLTKEALSNIAATTVDNLLKFERGEPSPDTEVCYHCERKETCRKARDQKCF